MSEHQTKEELIKQKENLENEIERLQKIIDASSETTFEIIIEDLKNQMIKSVKSENWATVKAYIKEVDSVNGTKSFIEKQSSLLAKKKEELEKVEESIKNYQPSLFEQKRELNIEGEAVETGFEDDEGNAYKTGDVYMVCCSARPADGGVRDSSSSEAPEASAHAAEYYLIEKSTKSADKFVIVSNAFEEELLMNYPKNREILESADYIGNIYEDWTEPADETTNNMLNALNAIADSQKKEQQTEENELSNSAEPESNLNS